MINYAYHYDVSLELNILYPSKTYKTHPIFRMVYMCCIDVLSANKTPLTKGLLVKLYGQDFVDQINQYEYNELIVEMISELKIAISENSYEEVAFIVRTNPRMQTIRASFKEMNLSSNLARLAFRISPAVIDEIHNIKRSTYGEVVELAIGLYIIRCEEKIFDLTYLAFKNYTI